MKLPEWMQEKETQVYAIPKGAVVAGEIRYGKLCTTVGVPLKLQYAWREAWVRYKASFAKPLEAIDLGMGKLVRVPDGRVWLVRRECDCDSGLRHYKGGMVAGELSYQCTGCHGTGHIHDLSPEDSEEVRTNRALMMDWGQKGPLGWITFIMQDNLDAAGLRFINKKDGDRRHDIWREKE